MESWSNRGYWGPRFGRRYLGLRSRLDQGPTEDTGTGVRPRIPGSYFLTKTPRSEILVEEPRSVFRMCSPATVIQS